MRCSPPPRSDRAGGIAGQFREPLFLDLDHGSIKVGILHSLSGTLTASERPLQQLLVMMIEKLNAKAGCSAAGRAVIMDPRSDTGAYADQAKTLLVDHKVAAISAAGLRLAQASIAVLAAHDGLCSIRANMKARNSRPTSFTPAPRRSSRRCGDRSYAGLGGADSSCRTDYVYPRTTMPSSAIIF